jgi:glycosyltransferase involved in cell wall biosynthesis
MWLPRGHLRPGEYLREVKEAGAGIVTGLNPAEIAEAIMRVLEDKALAKEMGMQGRAVAKERYSWPKIVDQLAEVYQQLIDETAFRGRERLK